MKFPVKKLITLGFVISVLALSLTGWLAYRLTQRATDTLAAVAHSQEVIGMLVSVNASLREMESEQRGYLLTGAVSFLSDRTNAIRELEVSLTELRRLTRDNQNQQRALGKLEPLIVGRLNLADDRIALFQEQGASAAIAVGPREVFRKQIQWVLDEMRAEENTILLQREGEAQVRARSSLRIITLSSGLAIALGLLGVILLLYDLKLRERAERELLESRSLLESILDNTPAVVFIKDLEGRYLFVNSRFELTAGQVRAKILGRTASELFPARLAEAAQTHQREVLATQAPIEVEEVLQYPDGLRQHLAVKFPLRDASGKIYATAGISNDITERKKAEEERDRFFRLSLDLLCTVNPDGYYKRVNPAVTELLGWTEAEFVARPFIEFVHPEDQAATRQVFAEHVRTGLPVFQFENRYRHKDGSWRMMSWSSIRQGDLMFATARDMTAARTAATEISKLNATLQQRAVQLEAANHELEAFSYSVSHDLRAPLRHIDGFVDLLAKQNADKLDDRGKRYLKIITGAARQMSTLIDDLLVFSRMGRAELHQHPVDLNALVHEAVAGLQTEFAGRNVTWQIASLPTIHADAAMLRQVLVNLIANAIKYSRPRDPAVIEIGCGPETPTEFELYVRDNGVGFDMEYAHKLFGVFQRLHRSEEFEGTGIGLANVRRIILRHGGRTWAEGKIDAGATFHFTLPKAHTN
ncbi:MAG: PAS domain-containing protein [Verrucomicrobiota bacterium]